MADTSGVNLKLMLMTTLKDIGPNSKHIIGQSTDGTLNMRGALARLKTLIRKSLNCFLCVVNITQICTALQSSL